MLSARSRHFRNDLPHSAEIFLRQLQLGRFGLPGQREDPPAVAVKEQLKTLDAADKGLGVAGSVAGLVGAENLRDLAEALGAPGDFFDQVALFRSEEIGVGDVGGGRERAGHVGAMAFAFRGHQLRAGIKRSEERRVGKECRCEWWRESEKNKE